MTTQKIAHESAPITPDLDALAVQIEDELTRLREKRPGLTDRIGRAANILVSHITCGRSRPIRVRVGTHGAKFLVDGSKGSVYVVDPGTWGCSCPDHHRRDAICKHGISCYVLWRLSKRAPKLPACTSCGDRFPHGELVEVTHDDASLTWFPGDRLCKKCLLTTGGIS